MIISKLFSLTLLDTSLVKTVNSTFSVFNNSVIPICLVPVFYFFVSPNASPNFENPNVITSSKSLFLEFSSSISQLFPFFLK